MLKQKQILVNIVKQTILTEKSTNKLLKYTTPKSFNRKYGNIQCHNSDISSTACRKETKLTRK